MWSFLNAIRGLDIRKVGTALVIIGALEHGIVVGDVPLADAVPGSWIPGIVAWCKIFCYVNPFLLAGQSFTALKWPSPASVAVKAMLAIFAAALFSLIFAVPGFAQTSGTGSAPPVILATKAPSGLKAALSGYPYGSSGLFFGIYTEGGGGNVAGSVAGVGAASLTTTSAGVGGTVGYAWGSRSSPVAVTAEADFGWTNYNGSTAGLSLDGPAHFEQRFVAFTPLASILSYLPNLPSLGTVAPFLTPPAGVTTSNIQAGLMAGLDEDDISPAFAGIASNTEWRVAPMIGIVSMEQLSNGLAMRTWVKTVFPEKGTCIGPIANACAGLGQQIKAGVGFYF